MTTNYTLDLNAGLTQVLADGTNTYLYGPSTGSGVRIGELQPGGFAYHLGDALGSVRQLANGSGTVTLTRSFEPYGSPLTSNGTGNTVFSFTGEQWDSQTDLLYLRARFYASSLGRFLQHDSWSGDARNPISYNGWVYASDNPANLVDPSGLCDNTSLAPDLYSILGCREKGTGYFLQINMKQMPWGKFSKGAPSRGRRNPIVTVPVRHPFNLVTGENCSASTQDEAIRYYLSGKFSAWEIMARNLMVEVGGPIAAIDKEDSNWYLADAIGVAYTAYNRVAVNRQYVADNPGQRGPWSGYADEGVSAVDASLSFNRVLLSPDQYGITKQERWSDAEIAQAQSEGRQLPEFKTRTWLAALSGSGSNQYIYEMSLIIAYGVHYRLFSDPTFGAVGFRHRNPSNPASDYVCGVNGAGPAFFVPPNKIGQESYPRLTTRELAARRAAGLEPWPTYRGELLPSEWITGYPPTGCISK